MAGDTKYRWNAWQWAALVCAALFFFSGAMLVGSEAQSAKEQKANQELAQRVHEAEPVPSAPGAPPPAIMSEEPEPSSPYAPSGNLLAYDGLWQENHDLAGWLSIEALGIDLPVMYTPSKPDHYLRRSFDGGYALSGSLFLGEGWDPEGSYAIIYGHNMNDGSMFGTLSLYQNLEYAQEHPAIQFDTLTEKREYTVLAAFYSQAYNASHTGVFRYYQYTGLEDQEAFEDYLRQVRAAALYDTGASVQYGDRLLVLTTCSSHRKDGRFVVVAYQKAEA